MKLNLLNLISKNYYLVFVTVLFAGIYVYFRYKVKKVEKRRLRSIKRRDINDAIETDSPIDDQEGVIKEKGIVGIEDRFSFIKKILPLFLFILWFISVAIPHLEKVPTVYISIIAAVISVVAGVSLRPFLENLFSGIVISFFKSIKIGDTVMIDKQYGLIEEIGLTYSVLKRWDWVRIVIPNSKLLQKEIEHFTMNDQYVWAHIEFYVAPNADLKKVEQISKEIAKKSSYFNGVEEPAFWVMELQKDTIKCWLAAWSDTPSDAWELRNDLRTNLLIELQKNNIEFHRINLNS